ncbi:MAG: glycogen-binding domain-containing protein [Spirochaetota bacterium]
MKQILLIISLLLIITNAVAEEIVLDRYSFTLLEESAAPKQVTIMSHRRRDEQGSPVEKGVLFTFKDRYAKDVLIAGDFSHWKSVPMERGAHGVWYYFLTGKRNNADVRYKFLVDGIWSPDPKNPRSAGDGTGSFVSRTTLPSSEVNRHVTFRFVEQDGITFVEFRTWQPDAGYVSVAGDFNNWNPENDPLRREEGGLWKTKVSIPPGTYRYKFIVDGVWTVDLYNPGTASDGMEGICSVLTVPER